MRAARWTIAAVLAVALTYVFWWPLWQGGGLIGGDLYPYYFPQKQFLANSLEEGRIPLWNNLVGFGYPVLGESQTGALYPPNLVLYRLFGMNSAYNFSQLAHYVLAFIGAWGLARELGLRTGGALLAAVVYVYGWFPARICLEWAIIGGTYLVWILWMVVRFRRTRRRWPLGMVALLLGADLLAGHYNLAFITLLAAVVLGTVPRRFVGMESGMEPGQAAFEGPEPRGGARPPADVAWRDFVWLTAAILFGFSIAAVQLIPSWELKSRSQRAAAGASFSTGYGHLPPLALTQLVAPWLWHSSEIDTDAALQAASWGAIPAATNKAEAFLYAGLIPVLLAAYGWIRFRHLNLPERRRFLLWSVLGGAALLFATGWPIVWLQWAPGFSYFTGPGRYSVVATLAIAVLAGTVLDGLVGPSHRRNRLATVAAVLAITTADLWAVSREYQFGQFPYVGRQVFYATMVDVPPIEFVDESTVGRLLSDWADSRSPGPARLYAPGPNVATLTGHSAIPVYLGIGPKVYAEREMRFDFWGAPEHPPDAGSILSRLRQWGVTHLLLEKPLDETRWPVQLVFRGTDPFLNRVFGRMEPYHLYQLDDAPQRAWYADEQSGTVHKIVSEPNRLVVQASADRPAELVVSELMYPGWEVAVDGRPAEPVPASGFRAVEVPPGRHEIVWRYRPKSVFSGVILSGLGLLGATVLYFFPAAFFGRCCNPLRRSRGRSAGDSP